MINTLAVALVPIFAGLLLGYFAGLRGTMDNQNVRTLITFVMSFAIPCVLFSAVARTPFAELRRLGTTALVLAIVYVALYAGSFFWVRSREKLRPADSSVIALTLGFPNSAAVGLPLLVSVFGPESTVTVATSLAIGAVTVSPLTLAILEATRSKEGLSLKALTLSLLRSFKKAIVWAPLLGLGFSFVNVNLPSFLARSLDVMGSAADGSALVLTGLVVSSQKFEIGSDTLIATALKNVLQPLLALGMAWLIHLPLQQTRYVTLISAMPGGFFGAVFGKSYEASPRLLSSSLIASYVTGIGTLAAWIVIVHHLG
ncbi:MAG TPA: AEC family transporter [Terriglobales bacterium]|nr:AEC family transporter [Terriglobales bacterium]